MDNTLQSAVFTPQTNWLLKKMLTKFDKYGKPGVVKFLGVDIENVKPIYFNGMEYKKAQYEECLFLFLDAECRIMGILKGNDWDKEKYSKFEYYSHNRNWGSTWVKKSRKGLTEAATHILMLTPEMRKQIQEITNKQKSRPKSRFVTVRDVRIDLQHRLQKYKLEKHSQITYEDVLKIGQELIIYVAQNLFNPELENTLPKKLGAIFSFNDDMHKLLCNINDLSRDYYRVYQEYQKQTARKAEMRDGEWEYFSQWRMGDLDSYKAKILTVKNILQGE